MSDLLIEGLTLAAYGMGTVFVFLSLLVGATALMSSSVRALTPASDGDGQTRANPSNLNVLPNSVNGEVVNPQLLVAITAAVNAYKKDHNSP